MDHARGAFTPFSVQLGTNTAVTMAVGPSLSDGTSHPYTIDLFSLSAANKGLLTPSAPGTYPVQVSFLDGGNTVAGATSVTVSIL